jgi:Domain of unknown function (DUF4112)
MATPKPANPPPSHLTERQLVKLRHLQRLSYWWDNAIPIPGTKWRFGLESLLGFLPFGGDALGIVLSCYLVWQAMEFGLPKSLLLQMVWNLLLDGVAGSVPMAGDLFDTAWKANSRNINLLEGYLHTITPRSANQRPVHRGFVLLMLVLLVLVLFGLLALGVFVVSLLWQRLNP